MTKTRKQRVLDLVSDAVGDLMYYDRKGHEIDPDVIPAMLASGEITVDEMVDRFRASLSHTTARQDLIARQFLAKVQAIAARLVGTLATDRAREDFGSAVLQALGMIP